MTEENWREDVKRQVNSGLLTEEEAKALTEVKQMYDVLKREIDTSDKIGEAIKHLAVFIKDLDAVALTGKPCYYIYRDFARLYKDQLVDIIIEMLE
jgi:hypothetical protein